ncbi:hypothetical protein LCGC14_2867370, partial [marine sediment metagenome]
EIVKALGIPLGQLYSKRSEQKWKKRAKALRPARGGQE